MWKVALTTSRMLILRVRPQPASAASQPPDPFDHAVPVIDVAVMRVDHDVPDADRRIGRDAIAQLALILPVSNAIASTSVNPSSGRSARRRLTIGAASSAV